MDEKKSGPGRLDGAALGSEPHGRAALLLVESLLHGLIAKSSITVEEAIEIAQIAAEVLQDTADDHADGQTILQQSLQLLNSISASLMHDLNSADGTTARYTQLSDGHGTLSNVTNLRTPKYFFHVKNGGGLIEDLEGRCHPDQAAARQEAITSAIELVCESLKAGKGLQLHRSICIMSEDGTQIYEVPFAVAVRAQRG